ncbi:two-component system, sensor histidine kinase YesM [Ruminococcaceae bacterium KH2T8]|nr:two-component system, sensor histidine kinase YesM [Ruminococcaceae bacterium KH2T8]
MGKKIRKASISLADAMTIVVVSIVFVAVVIALLVFNTLFRRSMERSAITNSEQSVTQVANTIDNYTDDMIGIMDKLCDNSDGEGASQEELFDDLIEIRSDVVMVATYDAEDNNTGIWSNYEVKDLIVSNLSLNDVPEEAEDGISISAPHVVSVLDNNYPWVVTITKATDGSYGDFSKLAIDVQFSGIAGYIDEVGIGEHGYCFIMDGDGNIIYHPQQQLIYAGLKEENTEICRLPDGSHLSEGVIYSVKTLDRSNWKIVGVTFLDETVNTRVNTMILVSILILLLVVLMSFLSGSLFSSLFTKPVNKLTDAMRDFEDNASDFVFEPIAGAVEVNRLSDSFEHLVKRIQQLMEEVKNEETILRKTELKALQAQIDPHFLYNTLDSISWMCEEGRNAEAVHMVNALAKLFRISISRGQELIPIEKEVQHAECYLQIQKYRYKNQFDYEFDVQESCKEYLCNKITLQPLIENALYHGLNMIDEGHIKISIREEGDDVILDIEDNGVGMSEEQIAGLFEKENSEKRGIGVKNVNDRIKIYFGDRYGITIRSELDVGTCVSIRIPKITEAAKYEK